MKKLTYSIFKHFKKTLPKNEQLNLNRHYKTLICDNEGKFKSINNIQKYTFPKDLGFLMHLTHDKKETETSDEYLERCYKHLMDIIQKYGGDNFVFFAYSTVFSSRTEETIDEKSIKSVEQKFLDGRNISTSDPMVTPGHLSVYTKEGHYISHHPQFEQPNAKKMSQHEAIRYDVAKSILEKQQTSTYIVVINKSYFPNITLENINKIIKKYDWAAKGELGQGSGERDNCSTAIQKAFTGNKIRKIMNPVQTLYFVVRYAVHNIDLTKIEMNDMMNIMLDSGLARDLSEIARHEEKYKGGFTMVDEDISSPTKRC